MYKLKNNLTKMALVLLGGLHLPCNAEEQVVNSTNFLVGLGVFSAPNSTSDCSKCDSSGQFIDLGYEFNDYVDIEVRYSTGDNETDADITITHLGVNVGDDFYLDWLRLYGKLGVEKIKRETGTACGGAGDSFSCETFYYTDTRLTYGIGARFNLSGIASDFHVKIEAQAMEIYNERKSTAFFLGLGYKF